MDLDGVGAIPSLRKGTMNASVCCRLVRSLDFKRSFRLSAVLGITFALELKNPEPPVQVFQISS